MAGFVNRKSDIEKVILVRGEREEQISSGNEEFCHAPCSVGAPAVPA
jgi:hypothetical protein